MGTKRGKYTLHARAARQNATRARIVATTLTLHQEVGPARATVTEIARRAGVRRLTVYNHFAEEGDLFEACQNTWLATHPLPDLGAAFAAPEPTERFRRILLGLYGWYRETQSMTANILRDRSAEPALDALLVRTMDAQLTSVLNGLASSWPVRDSRRSALRASIAVGLDFWTWRHMTTEGLTDAQAADLIVQLAQTAGQGKG